MVYVPERQEPLPQPALLEWDGGRFELRGQTTVIGRSSDCDLRIEDPNVSRRHAEIRRAGAAYTLTDLGSTNGTEVNGQRIRETSLMDGDEIRLGTSRIRFERRGG
jgi:pSer/pThr/pTyr-binding forkhead associated (FHA) protein